ncbi:APC family permease [Mycolicibacterium vaccae]|uniref:APC family permease n=1 Tax=Mycolicibacterium vaccae TaxID=1810 RepID=UPI003CE9892F
MAISLDPPGQESVTDDERLRRLGFKNEFKRDMGPWANFALGFTYLSPVVGIYVTFAFALSAGGPPMMWALVIAGLGQLLVALVFGEVVSQFPLAGGVYPWARRLWGRRWAWLTGWIYMMALFATISALAYGSSPYICALFGIEHTTVATVLVGLVLLTISTAINFLGTDALSIVARIGFSAELLGALAVGFWLLFTARQHDFSVFFDSFGAGGSDAYVYAFLAAGLIGVYQYYGFEACGDVAEEVADPSRRIPKTMRMTIYVGGAAAIFITVAMTLAVTDFGAVIRGEDTDPINTILASAFGDVGSKIVLVVVLLSFISGALSLQAAASRLLFSYARDGMIGASAALSKISPSRRVPLLALTISGLVPALVLMITFISTDTLAKIVSFATAGIYLGFQMVVLAALRARLKGWKPAGPFTLGRWGMAVNIAALLWGIAAIINMIWPRTPDVPWIDNNIVSVMLVAVIAIGTVYMLVSGRAEASDAPYGDAIPASDHPTKL